jgi:hypothetical protein
MVGCFIWLKTEDLEGGPREAIAPYAVAFYVVCGGEFRAICLAKILIKFMALAGEGHRSFNVVKVAYRFATSGVVGVIFFDKELRETFERVGRDSETGIDAMERHDGKAVTFWPVNRVIRLSESSYAYVLRRARYVPV